MKWFVAEVTDPASDESQSGSVKIRIDGHQDKLGDDKLREAKPMFNVNNPLHNKIGGPVTGLMKGSRVVGFFLDGDRGQMPMLIGAFGSEGKRDKDGGQIKYPEGDTPVATKEPKNKKGEALGGADKRLIPADDRTDPEKAKIDTKSILKFAEVEAPNPFGENHFQFPVDDGKASHTIGQDDPGEVIST